MPRVCGAACTASSPVPGFASLCLRVPWLHPFLALAGPSQNFIHHQLASSRGPDGEEKPLKSQSWGGFVGSRLRSQLQPRRAQPRDDIAAEPNEGHDVKMCRSSEPWQKHGPQDTAAQKERNLQEISHSVIVEGRCEQMDQISLNFFFFSGTPTSLPPLHADPLRMDSYILI